MPIMGNLAVCPCLYTLLPKAHSMESPRSNKEQLLAAADIAEKNAACAKEPSVKDTLFALGSLYRDMAKQIEELEHLRISLHQHR